jgi:glycosyltransferase involved in cell wall biosynthesis
MSKRVPRKPRIALLGLGTLGGGPLDQGLPVITDLFDRLSDDFEIRFYSFKPVARKNIPASIKTKATVSWRFVPGRIKFFIVPLIVIWDHLFRPHDLIFSVSVYPAGRWAIFLGRILRRPVVVQIIAYEAVQMSYDFPGDLTKPWLRKITEHVCEKATALVAVADYQRQLAHRDLPTTREIHNLPLRIDPKKFPYHHKTSGPPFNFIHVGYYSAVKDQDTMFKAFAKVAEHVDCHLTIIGSGYENPKLITMLKDLKIFERITFAGYLLRSELPSFYNSAHILLHPARFETGCAVIQEAMASGIVVCGTRVGILSDIGDQYAVIVEPGDYEELARKIINLLSDKGYFDRLRKDAYELIIKYDAAWTAREYKALFEKILVDKN